ncbi:MAG: phosphatase [Prevotella sp.]|nr:phosphatase [Prevotella sp.]
MKPLIDVHTHSIASGHAYSTLVEMVSEAQNIGLKIFGITEHTPALPGACHSIYFRNLHVVPRQWGDMRLLLGAELNIINSKGDIDLEDEFFPMLDIRIAGIHKLCWENGTAEENTEGMIRVIQNPWINIISHPGDGTAELNFEPIVIAAKEHNTLLEINNSSLNPVRGKTHKSIPNNIEILNLCKKYEVPVILGSDAHITFDIANYDNILPLLNETEFPEELIINDKPNAFIKLLEKKGNELLSSKN